MVLQQRTWMTSGGGGGRPQRKRAENQKRRWAWLGCFLFLCQTPLPLFLHQQQDHAFGSARNTGFGACCCVSEFRASQIENISCFLDSSHGGSRRSKHVWHRPATPTVYVHALHVHLFYHLHVLSIRSLVCVHPVTPRFLCASRCCRHSSILDRLMRSVPPDSQRSTRSPPCTGATRPGSGPCSSPMFLRR
jgi:hypothetical protein